MARAKKKKREKLPAMLAVEVGLKCRQFRRGTTETCGRAATCFLPLFGDACDECAEGRRAIRYATCREMRADIAA
ncbi:MAG: hypothetical protein AB1631_10165 [Acidobacteriota bacterium]